MLIEKSCQQLSKTRLWLSPTWHENAALYFQKDATHVVCGKGHFKVLKGASRLTFLHPLSSPFPLAWPLSQCQLSSLSSRTPFFITWNRYQSTLAQGCQNLYAVWLAGGLFRSRSSWLAALLLLYNSSYPTWCDGPRIQIGKNQSTQTWIFVHHLRGFACFCQLAHGNISPRPCSEVAQKGLCTTWLSGK